MPAARTLGTLAIAFLATLLLAGCQSTELNACTDKNVQLTAKIGELEARLAEMSADMQNAGEYMGTVFLELQAKDEKIAELEKEIQDLHKKLSQTPGSSERLIQGAREIREIQRIAVEKAARQAAADANKPQ